MALSKASPFPSIRPGNIGAPAPSEDVDRSQLLGTVQVIGMFAFEAARRIQCKRWGLATGDDRVPTLTARQLDCIALIACGKTDREIGIILELSPHTVRDYVEDAMRRYDVYKRTELVARCLFDGQICYRSFCRA